MGVPFEALLPYGIMLGMFGLTGAGLTTIKWYTNGGKWPRYHTDIWDKQMIERDFRLTGLKTAQTDNVKAPLGFDVNKRWQLEKRQY